MKSIKEIYGEILNKIEKGTRLFIRSGEEIIYTSRVTDIKYIAPNYAVFETQNTVYAVKIKKETAVA